MAGNQFEPDIRWLFQRGITRGCTPTSFCPKDFVSRQQMASFLVRALELGPSSHDIFTDDEASPHEADINSLAAAGITNGCGSGRFCPSGLVTRAQMASFLARAFGLANTDQDFFTDDDSSPHQLDINRLALAGITQGCSATLFCPNASVPREQKAAFLHRALD